MPFAFLKRELMDKSRTENLIGKDNVNLLASKHITVVGVGGVGGYSATMLVRAGIEKMTIIDFDVVSPSNLNRQIIAYESTIGKSKVEVLKSMLLEINKNATIEAINDKLTKENVEKLIANTDLVIDAIDSVPDKVALIAYCKQKGIKILSAMGAGNRYGIPKFEVTDIFKTHDDGLARVLRKKLKDEGITSLDVVSSNMPVDQKSEKGNVGSISYYPAMCGCTIAGEIVNKILRGEV